MSVSRSHNGAAVLPEQAQGSGHSVWTEMGDANIWWLLRAFVFIAAFAFTWISWRPYADLGNINPDPGNDAPTYLGYAFFSLVCVSFAFARYRKALSSLLTWPNILFFGWMAISIAMSVDVGTSAKRFVLASMMTMLPAGLVFLPSGQKEMARWFGLAAIVLLIFCYLGVMLVPQYAIHQASDIVEPQLAGDWRGTFPQKNSAAGVMTTLIMVSVYLLRSKIWIIGGVLFVGAAFFLAQTGGKTSSVLCFFMIAVGFILPRLKSNIGRILFCFGPLTLMLGLTVGTVMSDALANILQMLPVDATFTGRTDIWRFSLNALSQRPVTGYGYGAFWGAVSLDMPVPNNGNDWVQKTSDSHNGYLDFALTSGVPGLFFLCLFILAQPIRNLYNAYKVGADEPLTSLFGQLWLFGIYTAAMEDIFVSREPTWFVMMFAVWGLHFLSRYRFAP